jgi:uncharacterized protein (DUF1697 family)
MPTCISFLRGVNMTGHNKIRMTDLVALYKNLGFNDSETYIQSGNVIFSLPDGIAIEEISLKTEKGIRERFGFDVPSMTRTIEDLKNLFLINPYLLEENFDPAKMAVIFLREIPAQDQIKKVIDIDYPPDKFRIIGSEIFIFCPNGFGRTKLYTNFFENKMGVTGTARNWKTVTTIIDSAEKRMQ